MESLAFHIVQDRSVRIVLFRDPEFRLSDRQKSAVDGWMSAPSAMHCMRDHPSHVEHPIVPGLLGIKLYTIQDNPQQYEKLLNILDEELRKSDSNRFETKLWANFNSEFLCHDSVACDKWENSKPFPVPPSQSQPAYEGQRYDEHMVSLVPYKYSASEHKCSTKT